MQASRTHILCVVCEGFPERIGKSLGRAGQAVSWAEGCAEGIRSLQKAAPDVVALQGSLAGTREAATLTALAAARGVPLMPIGRSGIDTEAELARGLLLIAGLLASRPPVDGGGPLVVGNVTLDVSGRLAWVDSQRVDLTEKEYDLLCQLARRPGWTWTRQQLLEQVWGYQYADPRVVTVHVGNLRKKLARVTPGASGPAKSLPQTSRDAYIQTVRGLGYRFAHSSVAQAGLGELASRGDPVVQPRRAHWHPGRLPFVGRDPEMMLLLDAFTEVCAGHLGAAVLVGDAGVGKTRLAEEFSARVRDSGGAVFWARCYHGAAGPVYGPWAEILGQWGETGRPGPATGPRARLQFYVALSEALRARLERPMCLVIDNIQWADHPSLLALQHVMRHMQETPLMFVLIHRPFEPAANPVLNDIIAEITREGWGPILCLSPLTLAEVESLVSRLVEADATAGGLADLVSDIHRLTEGNALFLTQLVRLLLLRKGESCFSIKDLNLSREEGVRSVILQGVSRVSPGCRQWLAAAAVFGREFHPFLVGEAAGVSPATVSALIDEAVEARLLTPCDGAPGRCRFAHGLIRDVIYDGLTAERRGELHALAGASVESSVADEPELHFRTLAHHYSAAASVGFAAKAWEYCLRAARVAASHHAWEEACAHLELGLSLTELLPADAPEREADSIARVCEELGDSYLMTADPRRSMVAYERALEYLPSLERASVTRLKRKRARCGGCRP